MLVFVYLREQKASIALQKNSQASHKEKKNKKLSSRADSQPHKNC